MKLRALWVCLVACPLAGGADPPLEEEACAPPEPGFLTLDTAPWTLVYVDGKYVGSTPLFKHKLSPGTHTLTLVNESRGVHQDEVVEIEAGKARKLKLVLLADLVAGALDHSKEVSLSSTDCFIPEEEAAHLSVDAVPWASVFLDGRPIGSTPVFKYAIAPGEHVVRLQRPDGTSAFSRFHAAVGETVKLALRIKEPEERP